ncbi:MFS transporter [Algoriphagus sp. AK58]|uniref:MFS transporter n=1 Tax=Algoriphagus sp. AK58 TaxID=1406877 RepID=UPI00164F5A6A|nr:MFS transporter [Algoriphagus sp. AK58]MBC6365155.1 MFS transporter [Algoriphagus sp. AK58]
MAKSISSRSALILIVIAQFLGTSLWFAGNAAAPELELILGEKDLVPLITSMVQLGFVAGTFLYAFFSIPDRFSPSDVFFFSAILAAACNLVLLLFPLQLGLVIGSRFLTGFFLAGIYPVGMKIASDYFEKGLGSALGFLVGALVLGTAFPFFLKAFEVSISWKMLLLATSGLAIGSGALVGFGIPDGPFRKINPKFDLSLLPSFTQNKALKGAAGGYFGHMWELYTFWAFLPALILFLEKGNLTGTTQSLWTFLIIASGGISCGFGGIISGKKGSEKVALFSLMGSGICGLVLLMAPEIPTGLVFPFLLIWGMLVTADSPQFSTLVAQSVRPEHRGTALTLVNCLGFGLTIGSIQVARFLSDFLSAKVYLGLLAIGPILGLWIYRYFRTKDLDI